MPGARGRRTACTPSLSGPTMGDSNRANRPAHSPLKLISARWRAPGGEMLRIGYACKGAHEPPHHLPCTDTGVEKRQQSHFRRGAIRPPNSTTVSTPHRRALSSAHHCPRPTAHPVYPTPIRATRAEPTGPPTEHPLSKEAHRVALSHNKVLSGTLARYVAQSCPV